MIRSFFEHLPVFFLGVAAGCILTAWGVVSGRNKK